MPDIPLSHIFREPESPIAGPAYSGLSSLSSLSSHISTGEPKREEDLKEEAALPIPPKRAKTIEFYRILQKIEDTRKTWAPAIRTAVRCSVSLIFSSKLEKFAVRDLTLRFVVTSRFVVRRDWNFAEVKFGGHGSVMVRRGCHLGEKGGHAALSRAPVPSDNKSQGNCGHFFRLPHWASRQAT